MPIDLRMTREERDQFLVEHATAVLSVAEKDGGTLATPVWYEYAAGEFVVVFDAGSRKERAIRQVGRITMTVQDPSLPPRYVSATGPCVLAPLDLGRDGVAAWQAMVKGLGDEELAQRFIQLGADSYLRGRPVGDPADGIVARMKPDRWLSVDYGKSGDRWSEMVGQ